MENTSKPLESLMEQASKYGQTSYELVKLKVLDKTTDSASSYLTHTVEVAILSSIILFLNLGAALWLGDMLGKIYYGFLIIAAFYIIVALVTRFFLQKWIKNKIYNKIIKSYKLETTEDDTVD